MIDARLLSAAAAAWVGAAVGTWWVAGVPSMAERHGRATALIAIVAIIVVVSLASGGARLLRRRRPAGFGPTGIAVLVPASLLLAGALSAAVHAATWAAEPLGGWIDDRATAVVEGTVAGESVTRTGTVATGWRARQWREVRVAVHAIRARGAQVEVDLPITVRTPVDTRAPPPGTGVVVSGRLAAVPLRLGVAAELDAPSTSAGLWRTTAGPGRLDRLAHGMRSGLRAALSPVPAEPGSLVAGLAVGDDSWQPAELTTAMRASGLSHLTAVSGGNVAIVLGVVLTLAALVRLPLAVRVTVAVGALGYFVVLVGPQPSVLRAAVMGAVAVVGTVGGGRRAGPSVLATSVLTLVVVVPGLALSWGFALSALATAGLVLLAPVLLARLRGWRATRRWPPALHQAVALTVAAQLATLPVLVAMGGATGWVALPANLLAMPVVPPVTVIGLLAAMVAPALPALAATLGHVAAWPAAWVALVAHGCAGLPMAGLPLPGGWPGLGLLAMLGVVAMAARALQRRLVPTGLTPVRRALVGAVLALAVAVLIALPPDRRGWPPPGWLVIMCDVGQGDALLLNAAPGRAVLVDAGPDPRLLDRCLDDAGVTALPAVVLTHFHADHVRGLPGAFLGRDVAEVLATPVREPPDEADAVDATLAAHGARVVPISAGERLAVGELALDALWPRRRIDAGSVPNNASVVLVATVRGRRVLLLGDVEPEAQVAMSADLLRWRYDVVKVPHHGSGNQSPLLPAWAPAPVALVSVGAGNDYGHPAAQTVAAWTRIGAIVARTDRDGDVAVVESGSGLGVVARDGMLPSP